MATRPWAITAEVKEYSDLPAVQNRTDAKVATDITRAEQYIIAYTNNDFSDSTYPTIPAAVKTAVILLAEHYGFTAKSGGGTMKSETFDDYSYTAAEGSLVDLLDLGPLLDEFVVTVPRGGVTMKLRKL